MIDQYTSASLSPFLCVQPDAEALRGLVVLRYPPLPEKYSYLNDKRKLRPSMGVVKTQRDDLSCVSSIDEAEDHFLSTALIKEIDFEDPSRARVPFITFFDLNVQCSMVAMSCRRGRGWIALMHPEMFARISYLPAAVAKEGKEGMTQFNFIPETEQIEIGRWRLVASDDYRGFNVWVSDHLPRNETYAIYRGENGHLLDGITVMNADGGVLIPHDPISAEDITPLLPMSEAMTHSLLPEDQQRYDMNPEGREAIPYSAYISRNIYLGIDA